MQPAFKVEIDHMDVRTSRAGNEYVTFNALVEHAETGFALLTCNWRFQDGVLYGPYRIVGGGRFFTHTYVSEPMARAIYEQIYADLQKTPGVTPHPYLENGHKTAVIYPQQLKKMMPNLYASLVPEKPVAKVEGKERKVRAKAPADAEETVPSEPAAVPKRAAEIEPFDVRLKRFLGSTENLNSTH
jgi:hypothetical protein